MSHYLDRRSPARAQGGAKRKKEKADFASGTTNLMRQKKKLCQLSNQKQKRRECGNLDAMAEAGRGKKGGKNQKNRILKEPARASPSRKKNKEELRGGGRGNRRAHVREKHSEKRKSKSHKK